METITNTSDNIITNSYKEYHQVILTYITYRITHRYEAEDLAQDVFVRLLDYKQMLRPDTVKYFLFAIARNIVTDYIRRYYKKQEIDSYMYDFAVTSSNETEEAIIADDLASAEQRRLAIFPEQRRIVYMVISATTSRIIPVAMASGTTILGMLPLLFDAMFGGMAATIMGGLLVASALTLFVLPVAYCAIHKIKG